MKNDMQSLNDHLFALLEQVTDETDQDGQPVDADKIKARIARVGAGTAVAREIINVQRLALDAAKLQAEEPHARLPRALTLDAEPQSLPRLNGGR